MKCVLRIHQSFTDLTLGAIEATGTGTDVGLHAGSSIQTDGVTESYRRHMETHLDSTDLYFKLTLCFADSGNVRLTVLSWQQRQFEGSNVSSMSKDPLLCYLVMWSVKCQTCVGCEV